MGYMRFYTISIQRAGQLGMRIHGYEDANTLQGELERELALDGE